MLCPPNPHRGRNSSLGFLVVVDDDDVLEGIEAIHGPSLGCDGMSRDSMLKGQVRRAKDEYERRNNNQLR